jgi:hypothetical protein
MDQSRIRSDQSVGGLPQGLLQRVVDHLDHSFWFACRGDARSDSDWELLIVVDDDVPKSQIDWPAVHQARRGIRGRSI